MRYPQTLAKESLNSPYAMRTVGVSAGTAAVLGLRRIRQTDPPTTAYLMVGESCAQTCTFCTQAQQSTARSHFLSRVAWPVFPRSKTVVAIARSFAVHRTVRCCLQVTLFPGYLSTTLDLVHQLRSVSGIPICVSVVTSNLDDVGALLARGAERVTLALDAACERVYAVSKGGGWQDRLDLLRAAARLFPGDIGTHLIAGLGESEQEMSVMLQEMVDRQVPVGLFSFTPVAGTAWEDRAPPTLPVYRRVQAARYLLDAGACRTSGFRFGPTGRIVSYGLNRDTLGKLLAGGQAFQTAGCPGCNRPYYNERPGRAMYNYPRPLDSQEAEAAIDTVLAGLDLM